LTASEPAVNIININIIIIIIVITALTMAHVEPAYSNNYKTVTVTKLKLSPIEPDCIYW